MRTIEPCCVRRQLLDLRDSIKNGGKTQFQGYGDLSLTELLPALLTRYTETEMLIAAPAIPDQAADIIQRWMKKQWARMDGKGKIDVIQRLTIVADLHKKKSPMVSGWVKNNPFGERLTLIERQQTDTAIIMPDFAITGPVNMQYGRRFTATATCNSEKVKGLWDKFSNTPSDNALDLDEEQQ